MNIDLSEYMEVKRVADLYIDADVDYVDCNLLITLKNGQQWEFCLYHEISAHAIIEAEPRHAYSEDSDFDHPEFAPPPEVVNIYELLKPQMQVMLLTNRVTT